MVAGVLRLGSTVLRRHNTRSWGRNFKPLRKPTGHHNTTPTSVVGRVGLQDFVPSGFYVDKAVISFHSKDRRWTVLLQLREKPRQHTLSHFRFPVPA